MSPEIQAAEIASAVTGGVVGSLLTIAAGSLRAWISHRRQALALRNGKILRTARP